jgi:alginate O-acetyltransferase complex protein AlgI
MLFTSPIFLSSFLPVTIILYFLAPKKYRNLFLFLTSVFFYAWGEPLLIFVLLAISLINYYCGIIIDKNHRKLGLYLSLIISIGTLFAFKYTNFTFDNIVALCRLFGFELNVTIPKIMLPLGISFYTFQALSYTIDVYRRSVKTTHNPIDFMAYITLFPQLVAGPIVRYSDISEQLKHRTESVDNFVKGFSRFIIGLAKKMFIANPCGAIADNVFLIPPDDVSLGVSWLGIIAYAFQIYFDFSAYSDMAIGVGRIFGFHLLENFNYPYISKSFKEFWRRWHISMSTWFRDYLYIPLGGNRVSPVRTYINLFIVFFVTGFWHGASWNFIVWGLYHGSFLALERIGFGKFIAKLWTPVQQIYTFLFVLIGWVFFRADNLPESVDYIARMFGFKSASTDYIITISNFYNREVLITLGLAILFSFPVFPKVKDFFQKKKNTQIYRGIYYFFLLFLLVSSMIYIQGSVYNPFIYFRF